MIIKPTGLLALVFLILSAPALALEYQGYTEYDGRPAVLTLTFNGSSVGGELHVDPVCEQNIHLTGVHLKLTGVATGPWEDKATSITGLWTGGDLNPCSGGTITNDPSYPTTGSFTISIDGGDVRLVRMPTGYGYKFKAKGVVLSGGDGSGNPDLTITDISVPTGIGPGMTANIVVTYKNIGSSDAGPFKLYGYAFPSKDYKKGYESDPVAVQGLKAGKTGSINIPIHVPSSAPAGTFDIKVAIDNSNYADSGDVIEANENNNEKWRVKVSGPETNSDTMSSQTLCEEDPTSPECSAALGCSWESFTPDPGAFAAQPGGVFPLRENDFAAGSYLVLVGPAGKDGLGLPPATWRTFGPYDLRSGHKYKATIELSGRSLGFEEDPADLLLYSDPPAALPESTPEIIALEISGTPYVSSRMWPSRQTRLPTRQSCCSMHREAWGITTRSVMPSRLRTVSSQKSNQRMR